MPKQSTVKPDEIIIRASEESAILNKNGEVPGSTHEVWKKISGKLESRITPKNVYTIVRANRNNVLTSIKKKLGVCNDSTKKRPLLCPTDNDDKNSSSSFDQELT
ncbi:hypothetical protein J6590_095498 [Homalodisca vitripennis]|nr:hypothetical protein J6590_095498 [Homalodisca vitripennis]